MRHGTQRGLWGFLAAAAMVTLAGSYDASAQQFEYVYGSANCTETGLHGVKQLAGGGYVAVGESFLQPTGACGTSNAYVVVTNAAGGLVWSASYPIGVSSRATDVVELPNGDLVVCGYGLIGQQCHPATSNDIFLLHLASNGAVIATTTYGGSTTADEAWKLIVATVGDNITTFAGDYIIAGSTSNQNVGGVRGAYLLRVNAGLGLIWDRQYGTANNDDYFYGVDEVPAGFPGAGDIVATGGSTSPPAVGTDIFTARVNGNNGTIGAPPQNQSWTNFPPSGNEVGRSVIVLRNGPDAGDIVIAGYTTGAPLPSTSEEIFVVELSSDPCVQVANIYFGENSSRTDRAYDLVEDANPVSPSNVMVTGFTNLPGGFGRTDVFLQRVSTGPGMALVGPAGIYGGTGQDEGWAVANAVNITPTETPGYVVNGFTQSPNFIGPTDPRQLYLLKTDLALATRCERKPLFPNRIAPSATVCGNALGPNIGLQCQHNIPQVQWQSGTSVCFPPENMPKGIIGMENAATISFNEGRMTSYPNPLRGGEVLNLRFELSTDAMAHIAVSDITGRETYRNDVAIGKGAHLVPVSTDGWPTGTYLVRVTIGAVSATSRVVVLEK